MIALSGENEGFVLCFVTVLENPGHGYSGGLLMLNALGRPLEFHCTTPVKPSRAHEILYGHTLKSHLFGERLCQALIEKATRRPDLILTDLGDVMSLTPPEGAQLAQLVRVEEVASSPSSGVTYGLDRSKEWGLVGEIQDVRQAQQILNDCPAILPEEPFERIREALLEAAKAARPPASPRSAEAA